MPLLTQSCLHKYPFLFLLPFSVLSSSFPLHSSFLFLHPLKKTWFDNFNETHALCTAKFKNTLYALQVPAVMNWKPQEIVLNRQYSGFFSDKWWIRYRHVTVNNTMYYLWIYTTYIPINNVNNCLFKYFFLDETPNEHKKLISFNTAIQYKVICSRNKSRNTIQSVLNGLDTHGGNFQTTWNYRRKRIIFAIDIGQMFFLSGNTVKKSRIWGSHSGGYDEFYLLGYNAV
jgi:hypothetical protein